MKPEFVVNKPKLNSRPKKVEKIPKILSHLNTSQKKDLDKRSLEMMEAFMYYRQPIEPTNKSIDGAEYVSDTFTLNVQRYADFCKRIPEYCSLTQQDQISLLKGGVTEASLLRSANSYADHPEKQLDQLARMLRIIPESSNHLDRPIRHFYKRMADIKPTATELGILVALSLFSADKGMAINEKIKVEEAQTLFATMLEYECLKNKRKANIQSFYLNYQTCDIFIMHL